MLSNKFNQLCSQVRKVYNTVTLASIRTIIGLNENACNNLLIIVPTSPVYIKSGLSYLFNLHLSIDDKNFVLDMSN